MHVRHFKLNVLLCKDSMLRNMQSTSVVRGAEAVQKLSEHSYHPHMAQHEMDSTFRHSNAMCNSSVGSFMSFAKLC